INPPSGCRFHPRCPYVMDICRREDPPMINLEGGRKVACWLYH
ncbi:MAG: ABC transporter ATP-binding protein, partial [Caldivirga sp.]|nr:ABC transporter ATP-binding protein [Caldivirga sp.]